MNKRNIQIYREQQVIHKDSTNIKVNDKMCRKTINSIQLMKPAKRNNPKKVSCNETTHDKSVKNMSYIPDIDQSAYLKFFDKLTNEWRDDIHTDKTDIMIETQTIDPRRKNKRGESSLRDLFLAESGAQVTMVNYNLVRNLGVNPADLPETIIQPPQLQVYPRLHLVETLYNASYK